MPANKSRSKRNGELNKGVTHKIKKPKTKKVKESLKRFLSSPGISLIDSPETNPEAETEKRKFFTSRSKAGATIALCKGIKLSTQNGKLSFTNRRTVGKKNIGSKVEKELENEIKQACSLSSEAVSNKLENISKLSTLNSVANVAKPTRFPSTPSPLKKNMMPDGLIIKKSPRKSLAFKDSNGKSLNSNSTVGNSPKLKTILRSSPMAERSSSPRSLKGKKTPDVSPIKSCLNSPRVVSVINGSPRRSPRREKTKQFLIKKSDPSQMVLDVGQKEFGAKYCSSCDILYDVGDPEDEMTHEKLHLESVVPNALKFIGWKTEKRVTNMDLQGGRVIKIMSSDPTRYWNKVEDVLKFIDNELGFSEPGLLRKEKSTAFLYIRDQKILGCLIAEELSQAYEVIQQINSTKNDSTGKLICCSAQPQKVFAGVSRIWVRFSERRNGIASRLLDAMRANFFPYHFLKINEFAFSYPTENGITFAENYCKKSNFLVYG